VKSGPQEIYVSAHVRVPLAECEIQFARSSGPGGQNVNKVNSKALLRWNVLASPSLPPDVRERFLSKFGSRMTTDGDVVITSDATRDQSRNVDDCVSKLTEMLRQVASAPKTRKKTKPTRGSTERRHESKRRVGEKKQMRRRVGRDD
jgi:ribosome-associated protein